MTNELKTSPDRGNFAKQNRLKTLAEDDKDPVEDDYYNFLLNSDQQRIEAEKDPAWQKNNLEYDLRSTGWLVDKVKISESYAQNLYAALCNNEFIQIDDTWNILKENYWGCSWRYAGGIIADVQEKGDYMNFYCSGISNDNKCHVSESVVTDEIRDDLRKLGWIVIADPYSEDNKI